MGGLKLNLNLKERCGPYVGMVTVQFAQVGLMLASKLAMSNGMTPFTFASYSNAFSALILFPLSLFTYRSAPTPLFLTFLCGFFLLGLFGFLVQILGYTGLLFASASLSTTILNLIPGFTFGFAVIFRMEKFSITSNSTVAKSIGTLVAISGALIITLYKGPPILENSANASHTWLIGGLLFIIDCVVSALFIITQAMVLRKFPAELLILMLFYSCFIAILSALISFIVERDLSAWNLKPMRRFIPVIYSAFFGNAFQVSIIMWCVRRRGPVFVSLFHPLGVIVAIILGTIILGESLYLGSLVGSAVSVVGFYCVIWGKAKEEKMMMESDDTSVHLLQNSIGP